MARFLTGLPGLLVLGASGLVAMVVLGPTVARPWIAAAAAVVGWVFLAVYSRRRWRSTYAGRAAMLMTFAVSAAMTNNATLLLWPGRGYPLWEYVSTVLYVGVGLAIVYKLGALFGARGADE